MATFPTLNSGAVTQYPMSVTYGQSVQVIRFLDGSDQRFLNQGRQYRKWQIRLDLLNESEMNQLEAFFLAQQGEYSIFDFPDPLSNQTVSNCRLGTAEITGDFVGVDRGSSTLWVIETNG
jgi:phage-related protein